MHTQPRAHDVARYLQEAPPGSERLARFGRLGGLVPAWAPTAVRAIGTRAVHASSRRKWRDLPTDGSVRLHLGCGLTRLPGWVNVDLFATKADIVWDLRKGVPLPDGSVSAIFHEHMLEHLPLRDGFAFSLECYRVLKPGGTLRIGVPDAGLCVDSYAGKADPDWAQSKPTGMLAVQALFYEHGHRSMWDAETLVLSCLGAGFSEARRQTAGESWVIPCPDSPARRDGTLYVDARKRA